MGFSPDLAWAHTLRHLGLSWDGWGDAPRMISCPLMGPLQPLVLVVVLQWMNMEAESFLLKIKVSTHTSSFQLWPVGQVTSQYRRLKGWGKKIPPLKGGTWKNL